MKTFNEHKEQISKDTKGDTTNEVMYNFTSTTLISILEVLIEIRDK